jgi:hypothetical protein
LYIVKVKKNSKELVWQIIMVDGEWCGNWRVRKGKVKKMKIVQMQKICGYGLSHKTDFALYEIIISFLTLFQ